MNSYIRLYKGENYFIVRPVGDKWRATLRTKSEGPDELTIRISAIQSSGAKLCKYILDNLDDSNVFVKFPDDSEELNRFTDIAINTADVVREWFKQS